MRGVRGDPYVRFENLLALKMKAGAIAMGVSEEGDKESGSEVLSELHPGCSQLRF